MAKLEPVANPKSRTSLRLVVVETKPDPAELASWDLTVLGLRHVFLGFIGRAAMVVAAFMLGQGPIGRDPKVQLAELAVLAAAGGVMALGLWRVQRMPARATARTPACVALALTLVMIVTDLLALVCRAAAPDLLTVAVAADAAAWVASTAALLVAVRRLFGDLDAAATRRKTTATVVILALYVVFAGLAVLVGTSGDSELAWLSFPVGAATALLGLSFFVSLLWLVTDARVAVLDWQTRVRRAHAPDAHEPGDPAV